MRNYWQPDIDHWIIKESDGSSSDTYGQSSFPRSTTFMQSNANDTFRGESPYSASDADEEEYFDKLQRPYKGTKTLKELQKLINETLDKICTLAKTEKKDVYKPYEMVNNPYEVILKMIDDPELKAMLMIASEEVKNRQTRA
jgi:hypothetical protein